MHLQLLGLLWSTLYVPRISQKMGSVQVEQGFSYFLSYGMIFDSGACRLPKALQTFEKIIKYGKKNWQKMKKSLVQFA